MTKRRNLRILLGAMPWTDYDKPSIQIAVLKAFLQQHGFADVEAAYFYAEIAEAIGFFEYHGLAYPAYTDAEPIYSYLLFPQMRSSLLANDRLRARCEEAAERARAVPRTHQPKIPLRWTAELFAELEALHQRILDRRDWTRFDLVGLTLNYGQTVSSLYMAREIKRRHPGCKIVLGGVDASGSLGQSLLGTFDFIDYCCNGEGELPLLHLAERLEAGSSDVDVCAIPGIIARASTGRVVLNPPHQLESLRDLETPDFDEYFASLDSLGLTPSSVIHSLPIEGSRGCPYECSFCGVPLSWGTSFRCRTAEAIVRDMRQLSKKYRVLSFLFVDNITPSNPNRLFQSISAEGVDYRMFFELRANISPRTLRHMKRAGVTNVQIGVEALSTSLLTKMNKRTRAINNVATMKHCEALGIFTGNNLIIGHPLTTEEEIDETIRAMDFCRGFFPPDGLSQYTLQVGSRDYEHRERLGCREVSNAVEYRDAYPSEIFDKLDLLWKDAEYEKEPANWERIKAPLASWREDYFRLRRALLDRPILSYVDGGSFLIIDDYRSGTLDRWELDEEQRGIYLFADEAIRSLDAYEMHFGRPATELLAVLDALASLKLVFREGDEFISLAIRARADRRFTSLERPDASTPKESVASDERPLIPATQLRRRGS